MSGIVVTEQKNMFSWLKKDKKETPPLPPEGRSSKEEAVNILSGMSGYLSFYDGISPVIPTDYLEFLIKVAIINPDISHAVKNWVNMANNGHNLVINAGSDRVVDMAQERLNYQAAEIYKRSGGVDGLINHYLYQIAVTGAISSEDQIQEDRKGVKRVVIVPVRKIRFKLEDDEYLPYQRTIEGKMLPLNQATYNYFAYQVIENSPYAKPPMVASIDPILTQRDMHENIKFVVRKFGVLGLTALSLTKPNRGPNESDEEYNKRVVSYAANVMDALKKNYFKGLMVKYEDQKLDHHNVTGEARGAKDLIVLNEEQVASGIGVDSSILGRSYHSTETFANVMYMFMVRDANNFRRLVKRRIERTYSLDLLLAGIPVDGLALAFNDNPARDPQSEAQAQQINTTNIIKKVQTGMIDPDTGAQEAGYDEWFDPELINNAGGNLPGLFRRNTNKAVRFKYDANLSRYVHVRRRVEILTPRKDTPLNPPLIGGRSENPPLKGEAEGRGMLLSADDAVRERVTKFANSYLKNIQPFVASQRGQGIDDIVRFIRQSNFGDFIDENHFAERAYNFLLERYPDAFKSVKAQAAVKKDVKRIYEIYRLKDSAAFSKVPDTVFTITSVDKQTMAFVDKLDQFYLSKFISNSNIESSVHSFLKEQFLEKGEGLFGRGTGKVLTEFQNLLHEKLIHIEDYAAKRIINTSVQRMRNWANIGQLNEAGFTYAEIFNPSPEAEICIYMNGKIIPMGAAYSAVQKLSSMQPEEYEAGLKPITPALIQDKGIEQATADGEGFPPYHPNCHTRLIATERQD